MRQAATAVIPTITSVAVVGGTAYASQIVKAQREVVTKVFTAKKISQPLKGRYNILLVGADSGPERTGIRPDSLTVASIGVSTMPGAMVMTRIPLDDRSRAAGPI